MNLLEENQLTDLEQLVGLSRRRFIGAGALCGAALFLGGNLLSRSVLADSVANRKTRRGADVLRPYRCGSCRKWHLGHQKRKTARETPNKMKTGGARRMPKDSGND